jgi:hypothetical protein
MPEKMLLHGTQRVERTFDRLLAGTNEVSNFSILVGPDFRF